MPAGPAFLRHQLCSTGRVEVKLCHKGCHKGLTQGAQEVTCATAQPATPGAADTALGSAGVKVGPRRCMNSRAENELTQGTESDTKVRHDDFVCYPCAEADSVTAPACRDTA